MPLRSNADQMTWVDNAYYLKLPPGPPMQGDIWSGLPLPYADPPVCTGLLITPRCDLVHDKSPVINYVPLLGLDDYICYEGGFQLLQEELHRSREALRRAAEPLRVRELVDLQIPVDSIIELHLSDLEKRAAALNTTSHKLHTALNAFLEWHNRATAIETALQIHTLTMTKVLSYVQPKEIQRYKRDIARNTVVDLHFLPPCPPLLPRSSVILMRRIVTCGVELLRQAQQCITQADWELLRDGKPGPDFTMAERKPERILRLKSPFLEALTFRIGFLFGRIGVRDIDLSDLEQFIS